MIRRVRTHIASQARGDDGVALVVAIALIGIVAVLAVSLISVAISESTSTGRDRQRSVAVMGAEGRLDTLVASIQSMPPSSLPCGPISDTETVVSDTLALTSQVDYLDAAGTVLSCAAVRAVTATPAQVLVRTTARSQAISGTSPAQRTMETLLRLTASYGNDLDKAIYGATGVTVENNGTIQTASGTPDADVYTNGSFSCSGNQEYAGSIYAHGSIDLDDSCAVAVDAHAGTWIDASHPQARVGGTALAAGGTVVIDGHLGQHARATGTATGAACSPVAKCVGGVAVPPPPADPFPRIVWDAATQSLWQQPAPAGGGFTNVVVFSGTACQAPTGAGDKDDAVGAWIKANASTLPANTVVVADCPGVQVFQSGLSLALNRDLAVFSTAGFKLDGNPVIGSRDAVQRRLYLIQPWGSTCNPQPGIYIGNNVAFQGTVDVLLYSPCNVDKRNNSQMTGQIYSGGSAHIANSTDLTYRPLPVFNAATASSTLEHYDVEILYKRENR